MKLSLAFDIIHKNENLNQKITEKSNSKEKMLYKMTFIQKVTYYSNNTFIMNLSWR